MLVDRGYDGDWLRDASADRQIKAYVRSKSNREIQRLYDKALYRKRHNFLGLEYMPCQAMDRDV